MIDSRRVTKSKLRILEEALYGTRFSDPKLPTPAQLVTMFRWGPRYKINTQSGTGLNFLTPMEETSDLTPTEIEGLFNWRSDSEWTQTATPGLYKRS